MVESLQNAAGVFLRENSDNSSLEASRPYRGPLIIRLPKTLNNLYIQSWGRKVSTCPDALRASRHYGGRFYL